MSEKNEEENTVELMSFAEFKECIQNPLYSYDREMSQKIGWSICNFEDDEVLAAWEIIRQKVSSEMLSVMPNILGSIDNPTRAWIAENFPDNPWPKPVHDFEVGDMVIWKPWLSVWGKYHHTPAGLNPVWVPHSDGASGNTFAHANLTDFRKSFWDVKWISAGIVHERKKVEALNSAIAEQLRPCNPNGTKYVYPNEEFYTHPAELMIQDETKLEYVYGMITDVRKFDDDEEEFAEHAGGTVFQVIFHKSVVWSSQFDCQIRPVEYANIDEQTLRNAFWTNTTKRKQ